MVVNRSFLVDEIMNQLKKKRSSIVDFQFDFDQSCLYNVHLEKSFNLFCSITRCIIIINKAIFCWRNEKIIQDFNVHLHLESWGNTVTNGEAPVLAMILNCI